MVVGDMVVGDMGAGDNQLPLYVDVEIDDIATTSPDAAALALGISAGGLAVVGDVLIPTHAGQAFIWMAVAVVLVAVATIANRGRSPRSGDADIEHRFDLPAHEVVIDLRAEYVDRPAITEAEPADSGLIDLSKDRETVTRAR